MTFIDYASLDVGKFFKFMDNAEYFALNNNILEFAMYQCDKLTIETRQLVRCFIVIDSGGADTQRPELSCRGLLTPSRRRNRHRHGPRVTPHVLPLQAHHASGQLE